VNANEGGALIVVTAATVVLPSIARRLAVPVAVAELVFGVIIGRTGLGLGGAQEGEIVRSLGDLGFALFLFVAGMEIDVLRLLRGGRRGLVLPVACAVLTLAGSLGAGLLLGWNAWLGLAVGATSVPLMAAVLREMGLGQTPIAQRMFVVAGVGELVTIAVVAGVEVVAQAGSAGPAHTALLALRALVPPLAAVGAAALLRTLLWWYPAPFARLVAVEDPQELGMRAGLALMALFVGLAAIGGIEPLLGAFVAGLLVAYVLRVRTALEHKLGSMAYGFFVPIFFIQVGMRVAIEPRGLLDNFGLIAGMLGVMALARLPTVALLAATGLRARDATAAGLLLSAPLTLLIAVVDLGVRSGALTDDVEAAAITVAILAAVAWPALARMLLRSGRALPAAG
jgi:Kef-type K+ transport system membrane component KefB